MNFQFYVKKLHGSKEFKDFLKKNPKAFMCSAFFTVDSSGNDNQKHIDFYIPKKKEVVSFDLGGADLKEWKDAKRVPPQGKFGTNIQQEFLVPKKLDEKTDFDLKEVESIVKKEMAKQKIKNNLQKIMISLQKVKGKTLLVCTVFVSMFGLLSVYIDPASKKAIHFKKKSLFDFVKRTK